MTEEITFHLYWRYSRCSYTYLSRVCIVFLTIFIQQDTWFKLTNWLRTTVIILIWTLRTKILYPLNSTHGTTLSQFASPTNRKPLTLPQNKFQPGDGDSKWLLQRFYCFEPFQKLYIWMFATGKGETRGMYALNNKIKRTQAVEENPVTVLLHYLLALVAWLLVHQNSHLLVGCILKYFECGLLHRQCPYLPLRDSPFVLLHLS